MGKGARLRAARAGYDLGAISRKSQLGPEYPSLSTVDRASGAVRRLAKSRRKFEAAHSKPVTTAPWIDTVLGSHGDFEAGSHDFLAQWMRSWRMPPGDPRPDIESSIPVYVGVAESGDMPETSKLHPGPPYVCVTTSFIELCWAVSELFPAFAVLASSRPESDVVEASRRALFEHLDSNRECSDETRELLSRTSDSLFSTRTVQAAVRWAIAHEMAHAVGREGERADAYRRAMTHMPRLEEEQWHPLRATLPDFDITLDRYRDEIACDVLASEYVLGSPFARDDLITQVSGGLLAVEALIWHGWFFDESSVSSTHPSPTLRFKLLFSWWLSALKERQFADGAEPIDLLGIQDFAHWFAFEKWAAGAYGDDRGGPTLFDDIAMIRAQLVRSGVEIGPGHIYARTGEGIFRIRPSD